MNVPYKFTQKDVQFKTCLIKNQIEENKDELRKQFFSKSRVSFRASPLVKNYGWGIHYNDQEEISKCGINMFIYPVILL